MVCTSHIVSIACAIWTSLDKMMLWLAKSMSCSVPCVLPLQVDRLQTVINKLKAENVEYRNNSKTDQFEARIQELQQKLQDTGRIRIHICHRPLLVLVILAHHILATLPAKLFYAAVTYFGSLGHQRMLFILTILKDQRRSACDFNSLAYCLNEAGEPCDSST